MSTRKLSQDYGIQPNLKSKDESVVEFLEKGTWFHAMTKALQKHSELMEPWNGDYPNMEYAYPRPQGLPVPGNSEPSNPNDYGPADVCVISCFSPMYCDQPVKCHANMYQCPPGIPPYECIGRQSWRGAIESAGGSKLSLDFKASRVFPAEFMSAAGLWNSPPAPRDKVVIQMTDPVGNVCQTRLTVVCRSRDCCTGPGYVPMTFDNASTPDTVAPGANISVFILNGCPPYTWSVSGTGFSLANAQTTNLANTLSLAAGACGTGGGEHAAKALVTITDDCGTVATAWIQSTDGSWGTVCTWSISGCSFLGCGLPTTCAFIAQYGYATHGTLGPLRFERQTLDCYNCPCTWSGAGPGGCVTAGYGADALMKDPTCPTNPCDCATGACDCACTISNVNTQNWVCP